MQFIILLHLYSTNKTPVRVAAGKTDSAINYLRGRNLGRCQLDRVFRSELKALELKNFYFDFLGS